MCIFRKNGNIFLLLIKKVDIKDVNYLQFRYFVIGIFKLGGHFIIFVSFSNILTLC